MRSPPVCTCTGVMNLGGQQSDGRPRGHGMNDLTFQLVFYSYINSRVHSTSYKSDFDLC